jgi:hypothetical protein
MWRSNAVVYVTVPYNKVFFFLYFVFLTSQSEVDFGIDLVLPELIETSAPS